MNKDNQRQRILNYIIRNGSIDRLQSVYDLGIFELSARICELRKQGYSFKVEKLTKRNKYGSFNYCRYSLSGDENAEIGN